MTAIHLWTQQLMPSRLSSMGPQACDALPVESLALLAGLIVALAVMGGPLSAALSFLPMRWTRGLALVLGSIAVLDGLRMVWLRISFGATASGILGILTGAFAIWNCLRRRTPKWGLSTPSDQS